ncbi:MAG: TIGR04211 family SH3 domain-containing protein [Pseudomonadales bacterium]
MKKTDSISAADTPVTLTRMSVLCLAAVMVLAANTTVNAAATSTAEILYVTDELRLGLYDNEKAEGRQFKTLLSGARLEVLDRALMTVRVRTEEGDEGWVKLAYLVEEEPGRRRAATLEKAQEKLQTELASVKAALARATADSDAIESELRDLQERSARVPELEAENIRLREALARYADSVPWLWLFIAAGITFVLGCLAGYWWLDRRVRKQFGGVRVY